LLLQEFDQSMLISLFYWVFFLDLALCVWCVFCKCLLYLCSRCNRCSRYNFWRLVFLICWLVQKRRSTPPRDNEYHFELAPPRPNFQLEEPM
jgi:hypothetical protein